MNMNSHKNDEGIKNKERDQCVAHFWKSASHNPEISPLTVDRGVKTVALGSEHGIFLAFDGSVYSWGSNNCGQLGLGDFVNRNEFSPIVYLKKKKIVEVDCGCRHSAALTSEGNVYCWGDTSSGQCGVGEMQTVSTPTRLHFVDVSGKETSITITQIACGDLHSLGLTTGGNVWAWGSGSPLGLGNSMERALTPKKVEDFVGKKVISIACGSYHSMAIVDADGIVGKVNQSRTVSKDIVDHGENKKTRLSMRLKIPNRHPKEHVERSHSVPLLRKNISAPLFYNDSDSRSSESEGEGQELEIPAKSDAGLKPEVYLTGSKDEKLTMSQSPIVSPIDAGLTKLTNAVMSGVLSLTTSLTGQTSSTDGAGSPKKEKVQPKVKTPVCEPVCVQVWTWGRGTCGQLGHGTTQDR